MQVEQDNDVSILHITTVTHLDAGPILCTASVPNKTQSPLVEVTQCQCREEGGVYVTCASGLTVTDGIETSDDRDKSASANSTDDGYLDLDGCSDVREKMTEPALLIWGPQDATAFVGDRVLLKATYMGRPEPSVRWTRAVSIQVFQRY